MRYYGTAQLRKVRKGMSPRRKPDAYYLSPVCLGLASFRVFANAAAIESQCTEREQAERCAKCDNRMSVHDG